jgi:hypothetical protein
MEAHHKYNFATHIELRYEIDNGVTFCAGCHDRFHSRFTNFKNTPEQVDLFISDFAASVSEILED